MIPTSLIEQLGDALARWDGRGPTPDDGFAAAKQMATATMALLTWNSNSP